MQYKEDIDVDLVQSVGSDGAIVAAARVSTLGISSTPEDDEGLIRYLMRHRHGTPFEHNLMTFRIYAPIFVWREWHRHRIGFSYNEESARYKQLEPVFYIPNYHRPTLKIKGWVPGRPKFMNAGEYHMDCIREELKKAYAEEYDRYQRLMKMEIDPGLARDCLPVGIYSACWVSCNARSLMNFLSLRTSDTTAKRVSYPLYEIELGALKCEDIFASLFPITYKAFCDFGREAP